MSAAWHTLLRWADSDLAYSFRRSPVVVVAAVVALTMILAAVFAPLVAPFNPFDPSALKLMDAQTPPAWVEGGMAKYLLGTDDQGRDLLSAILYGSRVSLLVGFSAIGCAGDACRRCAAHHSKHPDRPDY
jgi:peptide/nickel transport system permease protein